MDARKRGPFSSREERLLLYDVVRQVDPEVAEALDGELRRQREKIELIASENFVSRAVLEAQGSVLTNKYAEGYPGRRYYGGCEYVDIPESLAIKRAKELFGADHVNVQPHSGAQANMGVYFAVLRPGDTVMGMNLSHGGHLTHGSPVNFSGVWFNFVHYGVSKETEMLDYDEILRLAQNIVPPSLPGAALSPGDRFCPPAGDLMRLMHADGGHGPHRRAGGGGAASFARSHASL